MTLGGSMAAQKPDMSKPSHGSRMVEPWCGSIEMQRGFGSLLGRNDEKTWATVDDGDTRLKGPIRLLNSPRR
jgi:hypothetical protein